MTTSLERSAALKRYWSAEEIKLRWQARSHVSRLVRAGRYRREPCELCGGSPVVGVHADYRRRDVVRWLCRRHHRLHNAAVRAGVVPAPVDAIEHRQLSLPFNLGGPNG